MASSPPYWLTGNDSRRTTLLWKNPPERRLQRQGQQGKPPRRRSRTIREAGDFHAIYGTAPNAYANRGRKPAAASSPMEATDIRGMTSPPPRRSSRPAGTARRRWLETGFCPGSSWLCGFRPWGSLESAGGIHRPSCGNTSPGRARSCRCRACRRFPVHHLARCMPARQNGKQPLTIIALEKHQAASSNPLCQ